MSGVSLNVAARRSRPSQRSLRTDGCNAAVAGAGGGARIAADEADGADWADGAPSGRAESSCSRFVARRIFMKYSAIMTRAKPISTAMPLAWNQDHPNGPVVVEADAGVERFNSRLNHSMAAWSEGTPLFMTRCAASPLSNRDRPSRSMFTASCIASKSCVGDDRSSASKPSLISSVPARIRSWPSRSNASRCSAVMFGRSMRLG